ncbi:hypothetical protein TELCIR_06279 [Teladorsagia circumcincta]|uniref:Uncharacterized protein n=1 Tax=Teladorsagia circumcincta TaxID=45464 RepID=A0A2G9UNS8_TELCI|nr:hypothetical protein TELCIR_06279 [Teladorsagia circumcincta]
MDSPTRYRGGYGVVPIESSQTGPRIPGAGSGNYPYQDRHQQIESNIAFVSEKKRMRRKTLGSVSFPVPVGFLLDCSAKLERSNLTDTSAARFASDVLSDD